MQKYYKGCTMRRIAPFLTVVCILLCLNFNYTFPLHRETSKWAYTGNRSKGCVQSEPSLFDRTRKMMESASKKFKISTQDLGRNLYERLNLGSNDIPENFLRDEDIRTYEQLVIMKKYPYLDLKELELKYSPVSLKNTRENIKFAPESNMGNDPGLCEKDEIPSVEITNRGLSGFAIPPQLTRQIVIESKFNNIKADDKPDSIIKVAKKSTDHALESLRNEVTEYVEKKNNK